MPKLENEMFSMGNTQYCIPFEVVSLAYLQDPLTDTYPLADYWQCQRGGNVKMAVRGWQSA